MRGSAMTFYMRNRLRPSDTISEVRKKTSDNKEIPSLIVRESSQKFAKICPIGSQKGDRQSARRDGSRSTASKVKHPEYLGECSIYMKLQLLDVGFGAGNMNRH